MFLKIDNQINGFVTFENVKEFFGMYFKDDAEVARFFDAMDIDGDGKVHWNEFLSSIIDSKVIMKEDNIREVFNFYDRDGKGYFTSNDFKQAIGDQYLSFGGVHASF